MKAQLTSESDLTEYLDVFQLPEDHPILQDTSQLQLVPQNERSLLFTENEKVMSSNGESYDDSTTKVIQSQDLKLVMRKLYKVPSRVNLKSELNKQYTNLI